MKKILGFLATGCLALAANTASAIPLDINITTFGVGAAGTWDLSGPTNASDSWGGFFFSNESWPLDIAPGDYFWQITGDGYLAGVEWTLNLAGNEIYSNVGGSANPFAKFRIYDDYSFTALSVPEPGTLGLLGLGLWTVGFAARRRSGRSPALQV